MAKRKIGMFQTIVYGLVGASGVLALGSLLGMEVGTNVQMIADVLLVVGGVNWGLVALMGDSEKDLLGLLGLE